MSHLNSKNINKAYHPIKTKYSIKRTVFLSFGSLTVLMFMVYASLSIIIAFSVEDEVINQLLATEGNYLRQEFNHATYDTQLNPEKAQLKIKPRLYYMTVYEDLKDIPIALAKVIREGGSEKEIFTDSKSHFHYRTIVLANGATIYLIAEVSPFLVVSNMSGDILLFAFAILLITLALSLWLTYAVSQRTIEPIIKLSKAVKLVDSVKFHSQETPLPYLQSKDEIGLLSRALQTSFTQLNNALQRETNFTRDVGHELRTPLTIITNTLSLNQGRVLSEIECRGLQVQTEHLKNTIDVLMALARSESVYCDDFNLRAHIEECILTIYPKLEEQGFSVILDIADDIKIQANKSLFTLLVLNLLENSLCYSASPQLKISVTGLEGVSLVFENEVTTSIKRDVLQQAVKQDDSKGIGQGLYLVKRIAESLHWQCFVESDNQSECDKRKTFKFVLRIK